MLGRTLGSYRIVRKIAQGGMGAVYEAVHATLGRRAAVKVMLSKLLGHPDAARRFFTEAKAISMVSHPCLVTIYEHGTSASPDGGSQAYIVMEYLEGESLRASAEKRYLGGSAIGLVRQLASALAAAHKKRIIHRDLKPDNIMLVRDDTVPGGIRAKLLDFGIAKVLPGEEDADAPPGSEGAGPSSLARGGVKTRTGTLIGTPAYMSPEQCRASKEPDGKTDVYSLGVIFYELLYGEPPFVSESAGEMYALHMFAPPPKLQKRMPALRPELADLLHRMLAKKPAERPSMEELITQLAETPDSGVEDGPITVRPCAAQSRASSDGEEEGSTSSFMRQHFIAASVTTGSANSGEQIVPPRPPRRRWGALVGGAVLLLGLGGALLTGLHRGPAPTKTETRAAVQPEPLPAVPQAVPSDRGAAEPKAVPTPTPTLPGAPVEKAAAAPPASPPAAPEHRGTASRTAPLRKEKTSRKTAHGSKTEKYQIDLWK